VKKALGFETVYIKNFNAVIYEIDSKYGQFENEGYFTFNDNVEFKNPDLDTLS